MAKTGRTGSHRRKWWIVAAAVIVLTGAGVGTWLATRSTSSGAAGIVTTSSIKTVTTGTVSQTVAATGTIEPATTADENFAVSGKVTAVDVTQGQVVTEGQTLATVDPTTLDATLAQAQATLAALEKALGTGSPVQGDLHQALDEFAQAARALRNLADTLERHPESLIFGKGKTP